METKANYVLVGIFTVVTIIAAFIIVYAISSYGKSDDMLPLEIRIPGSVTGLGRGNAVLFNGIRVGSVRKMMLDKTNPNMVIVLTDIDGSTPVTRSTVATLGFQGLTGIAFVELSGGSVDEDNLMKAADKKNAVARINADPSTLNNLLATAQDIFARMDSTLDNFEGFVKEVRGPLTETVKNVTLFSDSLAKNTDKFDGLVDDTQVLMSRLRTSSQNLDSLMIKLDAMLSPDNENSVVRQAKETMLSIQQAANSVDQSMNPISRNVQGLLSEAQRTLRRIDNAVNNFDQDPQRLILGGTGTVPQYDGRNRR